MDVVNTQPLAEFARQSYAFKHKHAKAPAQLHHHRVS